MYQRYYIDLFSIVYLYIVYFVPAISKRDKIFKSYFCVTIIFDCGCGCLISYYYSFFSSFSSFIGVICSVQVIIYFNLFFSPKSKWLIWCIVKQAWYPCTRSNHWAIWPNDEMCLMVYRIKWPRSSSHR